ncbi:tetratricopeptide repeat protein [Tellurirhabdus bombi]|uniref:tetratricopeptide repeat protein n=1 Tax=Tellurirhabdus bombi TaxID=2907205 RepID=UPI001F28D801|nr:tetratricopeptide repeat protein [Tellurirhabdus bombi]
MKKLYTIFWGGLVLLSLSGKANAQSLAKQADHQFGQMAYGRAIELYEQALSNSLLSEAERGTILRKLGTSYRQIRDMESAERIYQTILTEQAINKEEADLYLYFAQALASNGKYRESQGAYEKYLRFRGDDQRAKVFAELYKDVSSLTRDSSNYHIEALAFNTDNAEFSPAYYKNSVVFVSSRSNAGGLKRVFGWNNTPFLDLYQIPNLSSTFDLSDSSSQTSRKENSLPTRLIRPLGMDNYTASTANDSRTVGFSSTAGQPQNLNYIEEPITGIKPFSTNLNSKYHEGPVAFSKDFNRVYFTRNSTKGSKDGITKLKIYAARNGAKNWELERELSFNSDDYSCGHPTLSADDKMMIFASDMPGGFGGVDLYVTRYEKGRWSKPVNLGEKINTKGNEMFPFLDESGNLYFSSDGLPGLGELDIFYAQLTVDAVVEKIQNLGAPINSSKDDFGIITDGQQHKGYFCSNRRRGGADDDIYRFQRKKEKSVPPTLEPVLTQKTPHLREVGMLMSIEKRRQSVQTGESH